MSTRPSLSGDSRSGNVLVIVLVIVFAVICFTMCSRLKKAEQEVAEVRAEQQEEAEAKEAAEAAKRAPFHDIDAALADEGPAKAADTRAATVRMKLSEMKNERAKLDAAVREAAASTKTREADIARIRNDIADAKKRIARLKAEYEDDPTDEAVKDKLYAALVKLKGGEGVEGLETRLQRATAALAETKALSDGLARRLASLDSAIATAESKGQSVVDYVRFGEAEEAAGNAGKAGKAVDGLAGSTEPKALDVAAEDESAKSRRDAALESLLKGL
jgi:chromosome segregation ATPase